MYANNTASYAAAMSVAHIDGVTGISSYEDDHGALTETRVDFVDGSFIIGNDDGEGSTWTTYHSQDEHDNGIDLGTDGSTVAGDFADAIKDRADRAIQQIRNN